MPNVKDRILDVFKVPALSGLATITEDGNPWVRYVMVEASDDMTFRCSTFTNGRKIPQIADNPEVHLTCGIIQPTEKGPYLQIQGRAEVRTDAEAKNAFWSDRLAMVFDGPDDPKYGVVVIQAYRIESWIVGEGLIEVWERE